MPILTHKFTTQKRADDFAMKLAKAGYKPWHIFKRKGLKRTYIVQYNR
jgi:hypothetical protein